MWPLVLSVGLGYPTKLWLFHYHQTSSLSCDTNLLTQQPPSSNLNDFLITWPSYIWNISYDTCIVDDTYSTITC